jgi:hypothetical protein
VSILTTETSLWTCSCACATLTVLKLDYAAIKRYTQNILRPLRLFYFHLWPVYCLSYIARIEELAKEETVMNLEVDFQHIALYIRRYYSWRSCCILPAVLEYWHLFWMWRFILSKPCVERNGRRGARPWSRRRSQLVSIVTIVSSSVLRERLMCPSHLGLWCSPDVEFPPLIQT